MENLKNAIEKIEMPEDMKERIQKNCLGALSHETEGKRMKNRKPLKRTFLIAAVLVLCLPVIGMAVSNTGKFKDVKNIFGAITGTEYENATEEITVSLFAEEKTLFVETAFVNPDIPPYNACEMLSIGAYQIMDKTGNIVMEGEETSPVMVVDGKTIFDLSLKNLEKGNYTLKIDSFISSKKADQPLPIYGNWELNFSL